MRLPTLLALVALVTLAACSDTVDPTLGTDQAFSLYGYLDPTADRQAIRVAPILGTIDADTSRTLAVRVTSVERGTGRAAAWRDSAVTFRDGSVGHVFVADYTPTPGTTVELRVEETDGDQRAATVEVDVPALATPALGEAAPVGVDVAYPIRLDAPRVLDVEVVFRVAGLPGATSDSTAVTFDGVAPFAPDGAGRWALDFGFISTARSFLASEVVGGARLRLVDVTVRAFVADAGWDVPEGGFDEEEIVEPGTFSNVGGGFGFVGAGYWTEVRWTPALATQMRAGFEVDGDPASVLTINEVSAAGWVELYNPTLDAVPVGRYRLEAGGASVEIVDGVLVPPLGFAAFDVAPQISDGRVALVSRSGQTVTALDVEGLPVKAALGSFGSYPDGRSRLFGEIAGYRNVNIFRGLLSPTRGRPNRPVVRAALVNEVFSAGSDGWVELLRRQGVNDVYITDDVDRLFETWAQPSFEGDRGVADEAAGQLELAQGGGEIVVLVLFRDNPPRVVDVRPYGPQDPSRSSGLFPDGEYDAWSPGLAPTRNAPNAAARHLAAH